MPRERLIAGFAFTGYRSFGADHMQAVAPMNSVHLLAGPNNSGKSNVLAVAQRALTAAKSGESCQFENVDRPLGPSGDDERTFTLSILHDPSDFDLPEEIDDDLLEEFLAMVRDSAGVSSSAPPGLWINYVLSKNNRLQTAGDQLARLSEFVGKEDALEVVGPLAKSLTGNRRGGIEGNTGIAFDALLEHVSDLPPVRTIGAFRKIGPRGQAEENDLDGPGLIERLAELQNPGFVNREIREGFNRITEFVKALFEDPDARLEVPNTRDTLLVRHQGNWLPIDNYGTGLEEVIILAAAATVLSRTLVCIEEPEIHLHPTLQRRLLAYLSEETDNQYLIATHSAHMLDSERASISGVRLEADNSVIDSVVNPSEVALISAELGARASDLVQANAVVWVEGPSDRIYVAGWIDALEPAFVQGVHFEVLYYGGTLLSHLSADDLAIDEFVSLPRINRHFAVVIDSDKKSRYAKIGPTKTRVKREIGKVDGTTVWITSGYTIEDYVPAGLLASAVTAVHPEASCNWKGDKYLNPLDRKRIRGRTSAVDKVAVAREVMGAWAIDPRDWPHDLRKRVKDLVSMIAAANSD